MENWTFDNRSVLSLESYDFLALQNCRGIKTKFPESSEENIGHFLPINGLLDVYRFIIINHYEISYSEVNENHELKIHPMAMII